MTTPPPGVRPGMVTDLHELTTAAAHHAEGLEHEASFELFVVRSLEPAAGPLWPVDVAPAVVDGVRSGRAT